MQGAVTDAGGPTCVDRSGDAPQQRQALVEAERSEAPQQDVQRLTGLERKDEVRAGGFEAGIQWAGDGRMIDRGRSKATKAVGEPDDLIGRHVETERLDGDEGAAARITGTKDRSENPAAGLVQHAIAAERGEPAEGRGLIEGQRGNSLKARTS